jgi:hypothetical protein
MTVEPHRPAALEWRVFRGSEAVARGLLTGSQLRGRAWVRVRHDVYADARLDRDHALACRATMARLPGGDAVLAGPSAAFLHGVAFAASGHDDVHVIVGLRGRRSTSQAGVRVHRIRLDPVDVCVASELAVTRPARTAWDVAGWLPTTRAVAVVDALLARGAVTRASLDEAAARLIDRPGGRRAAHAFGLASAGCPSPAESILRTRLVLAGLPRPAVRQPVPLREGGLLRAALVWPAQRVALAPAVVDGPTASEAAGWVVLRPGAQRLVRDWPSVVGEVRHALNGRGRLPRPTHARRTAAPRTCEPDPC